MSPIVHWLYMRVRTTIHFGADVGAVGDALNLFIGGPRLLYVIGFGVFCATLCLRPRSLLRIGSPPRYCRLSIGYPALGQHRRRPRRHGRRVEPAYWRTSVAL